MNPSATSALQRSRWRCAPTSYASTNQPANSASTSSGLDRRKRWRTFLGENVSTPGEPRAVDPPSEHEVTVEPVTAGHEGGEAHPHVEGDPGLLGENAHRSERRQHLDDPVEGGPHRVVFPGEVAVEIAQWGAGVGLVAVGEGPAAVGAGPHRRRPGHTASTPPTTRATPAATRTAAVTRAPQRNARRPGPSSGTTATAATSTTTASDHDDGGQGHLVRGPGGQSQDEQRGPGHDRYGHRYQGGPPAGQRRVGSGRRPQQIGDAGDGGQRPGADAQRRLADVEEIGQRATEGGDEHDPDRRDQTAEPGHGGCGPRRPTLGRDAEDRTERVERGDQGESPQPRRGARARLAGGRLLVLGRLDDRDRAQQRRQRVLLVVHPRLAVLQPRPAHAIGFVEA